MSRHWTRASSNLVAFGAVFTYLYVLDIQSRLGAAIAHSVSASFYPRYIMENGLEHDPVVAKFL